MKVKRGEGEAREKKEGEGRELEKILRGGEGRKIVVRWMKRGEKEWEERREMEVKEESTGEVGERAAGVVVVDKYLSCIYFFFVYDHFLFQDLSRLDQSR